MEIQVIRFSFSVSDIIKKTFWHRKVRRIFVDSKKSRTFASLSVPLHRFRKQSLLTKKFGKVVEWSITAVLKTAVLRGTGGSNPSLSARKVKRFCKTFCRTFFVDNHSNDFRKSSRRKTK